jgi:hypothetical protein
MVFSGTNLHAKDTKVIVNFNLTRNIGQSGEEIYLISSCE